ncbi:hypothetical protein ACOME3_002302 [Neoechinorhynchus agilis]
MCCTPLSELTSQSSFLISKKDMKKIWTYKKETSFESRKSESSQIRKRYPDRLPIILEPLYPDTTTLPTIDKKKFLAPFNLTACQFYSLVSRRLNLPPDTAIFFFVGKEIPSPSSTIQELYSKHVDQDGFLYMAYSEENAYG